MGRAPGLRGLAILLAPAVLAGLAWALAPLLPGLTWPWAVPQAVILSAPGWVGLLYPLWALRVGIHLRAWRAPVAAAILAPALTLAARPAADTGPLIGTGGAPTGDGWIRIVSLNANAFTGEPEQLAADLGALSADVVHQTERRTDEVDGLRRVADNFHLPLPKPSHGASLHCAPGLDCAGDVTETIGVALCRMPAARLRVEGICVLGLHLPPPVAHCIAGQPIYLDAVTAWIDAGRIAADAGPCRAGDPVLLIGDLNGVPGGPIHRALTARGLRDALAGWGPRAATWPAGAGWGDLPFFQLDHALYGPGLEVVAEDVIRVAGSDHKALVVSVRLKD